MKTSNIAKDPKINKAQALAFMAAIGLQDPKFVRNGSIDSSQTLFECSAKSARKVIKELSVNTRRIGVNYVYCCPGLSGKPTWGGKRFYLVVLNNSDILGYIQITIYKSIQEAHVEFDNRA